MKKHLKSVENMKKTAKFIAVLVLVLFLTPILIFKFNSIADECRYGKLSAKLYVHQNTEALEVVVDWMLTDGERALFVSSDDFLEVINADDLLDDDKRQEVIAAINVLFENNKQWSIEKLQDSELVKFTLWLSEPLESYGGIAYYVAKSEFDYIGEEYEQIGDTQWYYYRVNYHGRGYVE